MPLFVFLMHSPVIFSLPFKQHVCAKIRQRLYILPQFINYEKLFHIVKEILHIKTICLGWLTIKWSFIKHIRKHTLIWNTNISILYSFQRMSNDNKSYSEVIFNPHGQLTGLANPPIWLLKCSCLQSYLVISVHTSHWATLLPGL